MIRLCMLIVMFAQVKLSFFFSLTYIQYNILQNFLVPTSHQGGENDSGKGT